MRATLSLVVIALIGTACAKSYVGQVPEEFAKVRPAAWTLSADAEEALRDALLAPGGAYAALAGCTQLVEVYGNVEPYVWIRDDEIRHVELIAHEFRSYGLKVPENPYTGLIQAPDLIADAAEVCAEAKRANIALYTDALQRTRDYPCLTRLFTHMRDESIRFHLPMYEMAAKRGGTLTMAELASFQADQQLDDPPLRHP